MPRFKLLIEYDGAPFVGWQIQDNGVSVQGVLEAALEAFTGERDIDAGAIIDYFAPLDRWLTEQNKNEKCGW